MNALATPLCVIKVIVEVEAPQQPAPGIIAFGTLWHRIPSGNNDWVFVHGSCPRRPDRLWSSSLTGALTGGTDPHSHLTSRRQRARDVRCSAVLGRWLVWRRARSSCEVRLFLCTPTFSYRHYFLSTNFRGLPARLRSGILPTRGNQHDNMRTVNQFRPPIC